jgi:hypothetical protein
LLNATGQINIPPETDFVARAYPFYFDKDEMTSSDYKTLAHLFALTSQNEGWEMDENYTISHLEKTLPKNLGEVFSRICEAYHIKNETKEQIWGIKRPVLIASLDRISSVYPDAKIVHVYRDGRDVYLSYKTVHEKSSIKFGPKKIIPNALYWVDGLRRIEKFKAKNKCNKIFEIKYEEILRNPESTLTEFCQFLEIDFNEKILSSFNENINENRVAPKAFMSSIHSKLSQKLDPNNTDKHLKAMSWLQALKFEFLASSYLVKYGYKLRNPFLNNWPIKIITLTPHFLASKINDIRYRNRDKRFYERALRRSLETKLPML